MPEVNLIFDRGPEAVTAWFSQTAHDDFTDMDFKALSDICWTRASTLAKSNPTEARKWGLAALAGYEFLMRHGAPMVAESAAENAAALRAWKLLDQTVLHPIAPHFLH